MAGTLDSLTRDAFLGGRLHLWQPRHGYRVAVDPVMLAAFVPASAGEAVLDIGCGVGAALLCLGRRVPGLVLHGLELQPGYADLARRNAVENAIPAEIHTGDLRRMPAELRAKAFDHVLMNPPYLPEAEGFSASDPGRDTANREQADLPLGAWIDAGLRRLRPGGRLAIVHRTDRMADLLAAIGDRAGAVEILPLAPRAGRPARRILLRARKGSKAPLTLHPALTLHEGSSHLRDRDDYTKEAGLVLRHMSKLSYSDMLRDARLGGSES